MFIFTRTFWSYAGERAIKTVAQALIASLTVAGISGVLDVTWIAVLSTAGLAGLISLLTSLSGYDTAKNLTITDNNSPVMGGQVTPTVIGEVDPNKDHDNTLY